MKKMLITICAYAFLVSCKTYHLTTENFLKQFDSTGVESKGFLFPNAVKGNDLTVIKCYDKNGKEYTLPVTDHMAVRIKKQNNDRTQLYLNTIILKDSTVTGSKSHFFNAPITPIRFHEIATIQIQK